jgi:hypothetical protein
VTPATATVSAPKSHLVPIRGGAAAAAKNINPKQQQQQEVVVGATIPNEIFNLVKSKFSIQT